MVVIARQKRQSGSTAVRETMHLLDHSSCIIVQSILVVFHQITVHDEVVTSLEHRTKHLDARSRTAQQVDI